MGVVNPTLLGQAVILNKQETSCHVLGLAFHNLDTPKASSETGQELGVDNKVGVASCYTQLIQVIDKFACDTSDDNRIGHEFDSLPRTDVHILPDYGPYESNFEKILFL